jgi:ribosomal protein S18 acetylase RimI-like enzyme
MDPTRTFLAAAELDSRQSSDLEGLTALCLDRDGFAFLNMEKTLNAHRDMPSFFLAYEGQSLLGALSIFAPQSDEAEIAVLVRPEARRQGLFSALLVEAEAVLRRFAYVDELFSIDGRSLPGKAAVAELGARHEFTEYAMRYEGGPRLKSTTDLQIALLGPERLDELVELRHDCFESSREDAVAFERATFASPLRKQYGAFLEGRLIGACSLGYEKDSVSINGLVVAKATQGRGFGQIFLSEILGILEGQGLEILLDVESLNANAFHIYKKLGFGVTSAIEYYRRALVGAPETSA